MANLSVLETSVGISIHKYLVHENLILVVCWSPLRGVVQEMWLCRRSDHNPDYWDQLWKATNNQTHGRVSAIRLYGEQRGLKVEFYGNDS